LRFCIVTPIIRLHGDVHKGGNDDAIRAAVITKFGGPECLELEQVAEPRVGEAEILLAKR
jgi:hypothetical protein